MLKSMTGYGRSQALINTKDIIVEVKSVNSRYFDFSARMPRSVSFLEEKIKSIVQTVISRGKVEVYISIAYANGVDVEITLNEAVLENYLDAFNSVSEKYNIKNDTTTSVLLRCNDIFTFKKKEEDEEELLSAVTEVLGNALAIHSEMRAIEGKKLCEDLLSRASYIEDVIAKIESNSDNYISNYQNKLNDRIKELVGDINIDEQRLLTEVAIIADKSAVNEEIVRLKSHIEQLRSMVNEDVPSGRKIDFLIQEINREVNTIGSKSNDISITRLVVDAKAEIEKIREQVQNLE